ncbi:helix-turn-helix domain-containing protein [Sphingobacterium mizutaii]|uniref:helix-turn-helix domain-containing protein n=1 Tax=Sphingobacterium mizutaii TaxID=1010 RepID=UPI0035E3F01A
MKDKQNGAPYVSALTENKIIRQLKRWQQENRFLDPKLDLKSLSREIGSNHKYITHIINRNLDTNFSHYINRLRTNYMLQLFSTNGDSSKVNLTILSSKCGFSSYFKFSRFIRLEYGLSPKELFSTDRPIDRTRIF